MTYEQKVLVIAFLVVIKFSPAGVARSSNERIMCFTVQVVMATVARM